MNAVSPPNRRAYPLGSTWISSQPDPSAPLVRGHLVQQPADVGLALQHRPRGVVQPLEPEPALLVGRRARRTGWSERQRVGQPHAVLAGEVEQGGAAHGAGEVQVQVGLGRGAREVAAGQSRGLGEQPLDPADALDQVVVAERVRQPQVAGRAERLARHHGDLRLVQDQRGQLGGGLRPPAAELAAERPFTDGKQ